MAGKQSGYRRGNLYWSLRRHMEAWPGFTGARPLMWDNWKDGIYQDYRNLAGETVKTDSVELHAYAAHILSSQAFAFNLFLPFREGKRKGLSRRVSSLIGEELTIERVVFEWVPPGHLLGELEGERPAPGEPATAVDVVLRCRLPDDYRAAVMVEVKLSEAKFSHCNGRTSPNNQRKDVCQSAQLFFGNPQDCYLRQGRTAKDETGDIGRYSPEATAACKSPSPRLTWTGNVPSPTTCSSRCAT